MRQQLALTATENDAWNACPWAQQVIEVAAGYMCFESAADGTEWLLAHDAAMAVLSMANYNPLQVNAI